MCTIQLHVPPLNISSDWVCNVCVGGGGGSTINLLRLKVSVSVNFKTDQNCKPSTIGREVKLLFSSRRRLLRKEIVETGRRGTSFYSQLRSCQYIQLYRNCPLRTLQASIPIKKATSLLSLTLQLLESSQAPHTVLRKLRSEFEHTSSEMLATIK